MAEAAIGLALGVAGLAGLFNNCIECFNMVQMGRAKDNDLQILHQKLDNQKARFIAWGESLCLDDDTRECLLDFSPTVRNSVEDTMKLVAALFRESNPLTTRYGLKGEKYSLMLLASTGNNVSPFRHIFQRFSKKTRPIHEVGSSSVPSTFRWVITDRDRFTELVGHLSDLINDLESLTASAQVIANRKRIIEREIELIPADSLPIVEEAGVDDSSDTFSEAASIRMERLSIASSSNRGSRSSKNTLGLRASFAFNSDFGSYSSVYHTPRESHASISARNARSMINDIEEFELDDIQSNSEAPVFEQVFDIQDEDLYRKPLISNDSRIYYYNTITRESKDKRPVALADYDMVAEDESDDIDESDGIQPSHFLPQPRMGGSRALMVLSRLHKIIENNMISQTGIKGNRNEYRPFDYSAINSEPQDKGNLDIHSLLEAFRTQRNFFLERDSFLYSNSVNGGILSEKKRQDSSPELNGIAYCPLRLPPSEMLGVIMLNDSTDKAKKCVVFVNIKLRGTSPSNFSFSDIAATNVEIRIIDQDDVLRSWNGQTNNLIQHKEPTWRLGRLHLSRNPKKSIFEVLEEAKPRILLSRADSCCEVRSDKEVDHVLEQLAGSNIQERD